MARPDRYDLSKYFKNGVLTITMPKVAEAKMKRIAINAK